LPILNPFRAEVDEAAANLVASEQSRRDLRRNVVARLEASHKRYTEALAAWSRWTEQGAQPLESQRALLRRLFEAGEISAVEYIVQLNQTFATEGAGVSLRGRLWATWFEWLDASALIDEWVKGLQ
jgi:cobalt-zinc-cadmium efflux system outer membrane protein